MFLLPLTSARLVLLAVIHMVSITDVAIGFGASSGSLGADKTAAITGDRRTAAVTVSAVRARVTGVADTMHDKHDRHGAADEENGSDAHSTHLPSRCFLPTVLGSTVDVKDACGRSVVSVKENGAGARWMGATPLGGASLRGDLCGPPFGCECDVSNSRQRQHGGRAREDSIHQQPRRQAVGEAGRNARPNRRPAHRNESAHDRHAEGEADRA